MTTGHPSVRRTVQRRPAHDRGFAQ